MLPIFQASSYELLVFSSYSLKNRDFFSDLYEGKGWGRVGEKN
jgi:hypothetical protein